MRWNNPSIVLPKHSKEERCFTRDASHELRTPLAVIKNAVELSRSKKNGDSADNEVLDRIYNAADQMQRTVQALLLLAREEYAHAQQATGEPDAHCRAGSYRQQPVTGR